MIFENFSTKVEFKCLKCEETIISNDERTLVNGKCPKCGANKEDIIMQPLKKVVFKDVDSNYTIYLAKENTSEKMVYLIYKHIYPRGLCIPPSGFELLHKLENYIFPTPASFEKKSPIEKYWESSLTYKKDKYPIYLVNERGEINNKEK